MQPRDRLSFSPITMLREVGASPTVTLNARVCETYLEVVAACIEEGWELNAHSYDQVPMHKLEDQRAVIMRSMAIIEKFWGKRPRGWFGPGHEVRVGRTVHSLTPRQ